MSIRDMMHGTGHCDLASCANTNPCECVCPGCKEAKLKALAVIDPIGCRLAGPGRGDCENEVGLPGKSVPGQHDGDDDTVDVYGRPNGHAPKRDHGWDCDRAGRSSKGGDPAEWPEDLRVRQFPQQKGTT